MSKLVSETCNMYSLKSGARKLPFFLFCNPNAASSLPLEDAIGKDTGWFLNPSGFTEYLLNLLKINHTIIT